MTSWWLSRIKSFANAIAGIRYNLLNEKNFRIHIVFTVLVILAAVLLPVTRSEWLVLILTIGAVLSAEVMNTAVEKICDLFTGENDLRLKIIKDSAAAAVLIISIVAAVIGVIVFVPHLIEIFFHNRLVN
jgi:undecaprenol kinase